MHPNEFSSWVNVDGKRTNMKSLQWEKHFRPVDSVEIYFCCKDAPLPSPTLSTETNIHTANKKHQHREHITNTNIIQLYHFHSLFFLKPITNAIRYNRINYTTRCIFIIFPALRKLKPRGRKFINLIYSTDSNEEPHIIRSDSVVLVKDKTSL